MRQEFITFHVIQVKVSGDSRCSRTLLMNIRIKSAHCDCEKLFQGLSLVNCVLREIERDNSVFEKS